MAKLQVTLDASKIRPLISEREYTNKDNETVKIQEVKFELVEVKDPKEVFSNDKVQIMKTHFACAIQTKEQRAAKAETVYVGEGFTTHFKNAPQAPPVSESEVPF